MALVTDGGDEIRPGGTPTYGRDQCLGRITTCVCTSVLCDKDAAVVARGVVREVTLEVRCRRRHGLLVQETRCTQLRPGIDLVLACQRTQAIATLTSSRRQHDVSRHRGPENARS